VQEIREELVRNPKALGPLCLGVLRMEKNVHPRSIELEVTADCERGEAAPAYLPEAEEAQDEAIAILKLRPGLT